MKKLFAIAAFSFITAAVWSQKSDTNSEDVLLNGHAGLLPSGDIILPVNQVLTPAGRQVELQGLRPQVLALSPDGKILATSGKTRDLIIVAPDTGEILQTVSLPGEQPVEGAEDAVSSHILKPDKNDQVSFTGLVFSPDGSRLYLSNVRGSIKVFSVSTNHMVAGLGAFSLPEADAPRRKAEIPAGLAISKDGKKLYVAGNLSNRLLELELPSGKLLRTFDIGALPYDVVLLGHKAYVSNWGGRRPDSRSIVGPAGQGTKVRVDPVRFIASEGSVSVVDLDAGSVAKEILVGLHSSALQASPDGRYLFAANPGSDTVSVIDTRKNEVVENISLRWHANDFYGASPNALAMDASGRTLYVCNGTQNAVAVVSFRPGHSQLTGLIPTGWYPGAIISDNQRKKLYVANIKGIIPGKRYGPGEHVRYNSHQHFGTLSLIPVPAKKELAQHTQKVIQNYRRVVAEHAMQPASPGAAPRPVPEHTGEPSVFHHVVYLVKENRTYDQIFGDIKEGNGDPRLCVFGEKETPNEHKMVRDFVLLDNIYCASILSADGHQWADTAFATDYMEKSFADFPRSYPDMQEEHDMDAMAYAPTGFIWDNALAHGKTVRDYGECSVAVTSWKDPSNKKPLNFLEHYHDFMNHSGNIIYSNYAGVESLEPHIMTNTVGWTLDVPDVYRAAQFIGELKQFEARGEMPNLIIICLPNDHTSGTDPGSPTPAAQVADNDLAFGQIVEAISHSTFWKDTCIFAIEDDPQAGWDHVSGYRTTGYVISPYTKRHSVVSVNYNQPAILRTIELMLGLPPMNQFDATANPMTECFSDKPDFTPFTCVSNNIPLDQMNPDPKAIKSASVRHDAIVSSRLPLSKPDQCNEDVLNHIIWHAQRGFSAPYPDWAITVKDD